jgi:exonuclease VII large subunit
MMKSNHNWLREHMRDHVANSSAVDPAQNVLNLLRPSDSAKNPGAAALDLVYQAAELIEDVDSYAAERQACAETIAKQAIDKLNIAHDRVRSAESARLAAEAEIKDFSDQIKMKLTAKLQEIEQEMEQTASRIAAAEAQVTDAEQRANIAEMRATEAENALRRIEEVIRAQILDKRLTTPRRTGLAA